ncbi:hypothetical protein O6H91_10G064600 [Diphasiastrum complanatum]|uniref:Uncharacterized protein n=2 Tax=Diphasiastrum complanatum TaxID=34168 RepID=A0ACC2CHX7_DIPCM|nr:hypothetical protein O6H91_10G064600 [Diphasiastrum complanatum]KAJ7541551.1 hypothetical protein O6H91_10G064600 [Diphasiastrum complanatum]
MPGRSPSRSGQGMDSTSSNGALSSAKAYARADLTNNPEIGDSGEVVEARRGLESQLWHACAGGMVQLPPVGVKVIYFPQGHAEQAASPPDFRGTLPTSGAIPCRVLALNYLADAETDEVYARIGLQPDRADEEGHESPPPPPLEKPASFAKTLTQSDANNGGGFSVPRYCAETIFPRLDYTVDPPVQTVLAKDVHGEIWKFRHIYRGTPRRHLLTTGWSTFVNHKKLVAGDAIVFLRSASGELCVGVRRSMRSNGGGGGGDPLSWHSSSLGGMPVPGQQQQRAGYSELLAADCGSIGMINSSPSAGSAGATGRPGSAAIATSFARNRARVTAKSVQEAASLAAAGQPFEVVFYPRASTAEFCVRSHAVRAALAHTWYPGMRFKMAFETEDSSRISWFMGNVCAVQPADPIQWPNSPWRILQVAWDEPDLLQGVLRISPWQVELVSSLPIQLPPFSLPKKKFRVSQPPEFQSAEGQAFMGLPMTTLANSMMGQLNPLHNILDDFPAGMQGARHDRIYGLTTPYIQPQNGQPRVLDMYPHESPTLLKRGSTGLGFGSSSLFESFTVQSSHVKPASVANKCQSESVSSTVPSCSASSNTRTTPFVLFGKSIDPTFTATPEQQHSGGSSSESTSHQHLKESSSQTNRTSANSTCGRDWSDSFEKVQSFVTGFSDGLKSNYTDSSFQQEIHPPRSIPEVGSLKWFKEQASLLTSEKKDMSEKSNGDSLIHCKIFMESEEIGRTIDLSTYSTYEELYERLATMFSIDKLKLAGRIVYKDLEGSTIHVGGEPYRNFMKSVRRLTILS